MLETVRKGSFVKHFVGAGDTDIVCFKFWQVVVASGCPGACAYCFLPTQTPYRRSLYDVNGTLFTNLRDMEFQVRQWLKQQKEPAGLIVGENQDGLAFEYPYKKLLGITPLEILIPLFANENPVGHDLIVLSKFTATRFVEEIGPTPHVILSWSLSLPSISQRYEKRVASLDARLKKAAALKAAGHRVRFRLDALAPVPGWQEDLTEIMRRINEVRPEMLTVGALRASNTKLLRAAAELLGRDASIFDYLGAPDPSGFKHRTESNFHREVFRMIGEQLAPGIKLGLCKEDVSMWEGADISWQGCHCLHGDTDAVTVPRLHLIERTQRRRVESAA